jgi:histidine triad (HIT) family protein
MPIAERGSDSDATEACAFCEIVAGRMPADVVWEDERTLAFVDLRQAHPGHVLVIPRGHLPDARELDDDTGAALMATLVRVLRAVDGAFPSAGLSVWHSIGAAAFQEVPHLHLHVLPRRENDGLLRVYPTDPEDADPVLRAEVARRLRERLRPRSHAVSESSS